MSCRAARWQAAATEFGEAGTPFLQEKDPLIKRETLELVRSCYKIRESRVRQGIYEVIRALGAASNADLLGGRKKRRLGVLPGNDKWFVDEAGARGAK